MTPSSIFFFWSFPVSLVKFSYWSKFFCQYRDVPGVMTIFVIKGFTRKSEIVNNPVWVLPNIWRLGKLGTSNLALLPLIKSYWMLQKTRAAAFTFSEVLRESQQRGKVNLPPPPLRSGLIGDFRLFNRILNFSFIFPNRLTWR